MAADPYLDLADPRHPAGPDGRAAPPPARDQLAARCLSQAAEEDRPLFEVEEALTGFSHAEVGAYLLSLWGLPYAVVESVAHHHHPRRVPATGIDMITVVYVTNVLAHEREAGESGSTPPAIDMEYLAQIGAVEKLADWRKIAEGVEIGALMS